MSKYVITTVQTIVRKYYVKVDDPSWAHDGIVMNELEEFTQHHLSEDIVDTQKVKRWPTPDQYDSVNAAVMEFDYNDDQWKATTRWDLANEEF